MKTWVKIVIAIGVVLVIGAIVAASLLTGEGAKGVEVYMAKAKRRDLIPAVSATGRIEPRTKVEVQSSVIGEIVELPVREGDRVHKGDLLVQLDPDRYRAEVDRLEATLRINRIAVEQQEVSLENARRSLDRHRRLHGEGFVSPELLEESELEVRSGEINLKSLHEQISQAQAALDKARDELRKTTIRAPIDGAVTKLNAELGEMIITGTMNNPGTVIMVVSDMSEILAEVDVDETRIVKVEPGQPARVVVDAIGETHPYRGMVAEIAGTAVQQRGQEVQVFPVKIALESADARLRPGMTAKARIETHRAEDAVTVPIQAVLLRPERDVEEILAERDGGENKIGASSAGGDGDEQAGPSPKEEQDEEASGDPSSDKREVVFRVVDGKALLTPVETGVSDETDVVVLEGLEEGDTVVNGPYRAMKKLKDGDAVREKGKAGGEGEDDEPEPASAEDEE